MDLLKNRIIAGFLRRAGVPLVAGAVYFLIAVATINFTHSQGGIAPIWPANAVLLAAILRLPRAHAPWIIMAGTIGNALAVLATGSGMPEPIFYALPSTAELAVATIGLKAVEGRQRVLSEASAVGHVLLWAGLLAPAVSASLGALSCWFLFGHPLTQSFMLWYLSDALGLLIFTPFFMALLTGDFTRGISEMSRFRRLEFAALLLLTVATTSFVFFFARYPLLFLVMAPMMLVAFRSGWLATKFALAIVAVIGGVATMSGYGPIANQISDPNIQVYGIQIYIATMLLTQMPIAAALTARQELIEKLRDSEQSLRLLASRSPILLLSFDLDGVCERVVGTSDILLDRASTDLVGGSFCDVSEEGQYELRRAHSAALEDLSQSHGAEFRTVKVNDIWLEAVFRAHFNEGGRCVGTLATIHDITQRKNQELSLSRTATTDSLTGLLNRAGFRARLEHALLSATPGALSIAMIDVDRFKLINDNSGHQVGDIVLREIARRIGSQVRASDAVGRLGGDEFVVLLSTPNWERVQEICNRIVAAVGVEPVILPSGNGLRTAVSCGVTRYRVGQSADEVIHDADLALYRAKRAGRNRVVAA